MGTAPFCCAETWKCLKTLKPRTCILNGMTPILKQQDRDITGMSIPFIYGWMRPGPAKERAVMSLAVGPYS